MVSTTHTLYNQRHTPLDWHNICGACKNLQLSPTHPKKNLKGKVLCQCDEREPTSLIHAQTHTNIPCNSEDLKSPSLTPRLITCHKKSKCKVWMTCEAIFFVGGGGVNSDCMASPKTLTVTVLAWFYAVCQHPCHQHRTWHQSRLESDCHGHRCHPCIPLQRHPCAW